MKKIYLILFVFLTCLAAQCQPYASGSAGLTYFKDISSISGNFEIGLKQPLNDCPQYSGFFDGGLMVAGGMVAMLDAAAPATFYLKGGKSFVIGYGQELELSAGYSWRKVSTDDKSRNSKAPIYSLSWLNTVSDIGQWVVNISAGKSFVSASIGMRISFINRYKY